MWNKRRMAGVTLVELIMAIVIVGIALAGLVAAYNRASIASTDPLITQQMLAIAETMMEEVMLKPWENNNIRDPLHAQFDELDDYTGYEKRPVANVDGSAIEGLGGYTVSVAIAQATQDLAGIRADHVRHISVTVEKGSQSLTLNGWRTKP